MAEQDGAGDVAEQAEYHELDPEGEGLLLLADTAQDDHQHRHLGDGHQQGHEEQQDHEGEDHVAGGVAGALRGHRHPGHGHVEVRAAVRRVPHAGAVGVVVAGEERGAARVARREVGQPVGAAHRLHVVHVALAAEVAAVGQVDLETLGGVLGVGHGGAGHGHVVAAQEEEETVRGEAEQVADEDELHGAARPQLQLLEDVSAEDDADACAGDGGAAGQHARLGLAQVELGLEILGQEHDEAGHDDELAAGAQARHQEYPVGYEFPNAFWQVGQIFAIILDLLTLILHLVGRGNF